jgi:hypothetical protein
LQINHIEADFDDGNNFIKYNINEIIDIYYKFPGEKTIKLKVFFDNDSVLYTTFKSQTLCQEIPPYNIQITKTSTIHHEGWYDTNNENDTLGWHGQAIVTVWLAPGNTVMTKPFIVLDGFDPFLPGHIQSRHYPKLYCDLNQVHTLDMLQQCYGYDIVIVDWEGGADWIQKKRNVPCGGSKLG